MGYKTIIRKFLMILLILVLIFISLKFAMFYIPFLIAYCIGVILEPLIKKICKYFNISRKLSSIIVLVIIFGIIIGLIILGAVVLISESSTLLNGLNTYLEKAIEVINLLLTNINLSKLNISNEINDIIKNTSTDFLNNITSFIKDILNSIIETIKFIPEILIYIVITILSTYFILSDKIYIKDRLEHHIPKKILGKIYVKVEKITKSLGGYLKAEIILIGINFIIVLMGLNIFYLIGMDVGYPLLMALFISFVDALPILGSGAVMIPWSIILLLNQNYAVGFSILGLYIGIIVVRQILEPKIVSNKIGVHPIFTLISMYTGFKLIGVFGLLVGPIILIILKNIFEDSLDNGIAKSIDEYISSN